MRHRTLAIAIAAALALSIAVEARAEEGATHLDGGICIEADGTQGLSRYDGECITPADYDTIYSYDNLNTIPDQVAAWQGEDVSIAEAAELSPTPAASERLIGEGLVDVPRTFTEIVRAAHLPVPA